MAVLGGGVLRLAQCMPSAIKNAVKIRIKTLKFNDHFLMCTSKFDDHYAHDSENRCKPGDIVLVKELEQKLTTKVTYTLVDIVYPFGDVVDPITNKKVTGNDYREDIERRRQLFGLNEYGFDYEKAPPRGWQENKKDFSHREGYRKFDDKKVDKPHEIGVDVIRKRRRVWRK